MAITKLLRIKEAKNRPSPSAHLKNNIRYICRDDKTENGLWIGGNAGQTADTIYQTMIENKQSWDKTGGSQGFHYVLSFPLDADIPPYMALQIAQEFCEELLGDDFYYVIAAHTDTGHLHVHITFDSVSKTDGHKFWSPKGDWEKRIQPITDRLCKKYGLPTLTEDLDKRKIPQNDRRGTNYGEWKHTKNGGRGFYSWSDILRDDIDEAIRHTENYEDFLEYLKVDRYEIRDKEALSLRLPEMKRAIRTGRLGSGYGKEEILERLKAKEQEPGIERQYQIYGNWVEVQRIFCMKVTQTPGWSMTPFQRRFYERWQNTFFIRRPDRRAQAWKYKKDILQVQKLSDAIGYTVINDIQTLYDFEKKVQELELQCHAAQLEVTRLRTGWNKSQSRYLLQKYKELADAYRKKPDEETRENYYEILSEIDRYGGLPGLERLKEETERKIRETKEKAKAVKKETKRVHEFFSLLDGQDREGQERNTAFLKEPEEPEKEEISVSIESDDRAEKGFFYSGALLADGRQVEIPLEDCRMTGHGNTLCIHIRKNYQYRIFDGEGKACGTIFSKSFLERQKETKMPVVMPEAEKRKNSK